MRKSTRPGESRQHNSENSQPPVSSSDYERWLHRRSNTGNYFAFFRDFLTVMSADAAILVQSIINLGRGVSQDGWVKCSTQFITDTLHMSGKVQKRVFRELRAYNFVETEVRGIPPNRFVRVNLLEIERAIDYFTNDPPMDDTGYIPPNDDGDKPPSNTSNRTNASDSIGSKRNQLHSSKRDQSIGIKEKSVNGNPLHHSDSFASLTNLNDASAARTRPTKQKSKRVNATNPKGLRSGTKRKRSGNPADSRSGVPPPQVSLNDESPPGLQSKVVDDPKSNDNTLSDNITMDELAVFAPQVDSPKLMAKRLREHCDDMGWTINNNRGGAKEFVKLIREHGEHIVWDRLLAYIRYKITKPDVHSGHDFRCYWNWIGDEVTKRRELEPPAKLSPVAKEIITELFNYPWHETAKQQLPAVVTHSLNNLNAFIAKLRVASVDNSVRDQILPELEPVRFLTMWFRNVWDRYKKFDAWAGNLQPSIWTYNHKDFTAFAKRILVKWAGHDDGSWERLIESLNAKEKS